MAEQIDQPAPEDVALMLKRAGVTVPSEQLKDCCVVVGRLEAAARRLRKNLQRNDEPASVFFIRR